MEAIAAACAGFLIAVLWMDLMFDVQVLRHRRAAAVPEDVVESIATYYRRVTTAAQPMGRLIAAVMLALLTVLVAQLVAGDVPRWASVVSLAGAGVAIGLAGARVVPSARRLGARGEPPAARAALARGICRDHLVCLAAMTTVLSVQLAVA